MNMQITGITMQMVCVQLRSRRRTIEQRRVERRMVERRMVEQRHA